MADGSKPEATTKAPLSPPRRKGIERRTWTQRRRADLLRTDRRAGRKGRKDLARTDGQGRTNPNRALRKDNHPRDPARNGGHRRQAYGRSNGEGRQAAGRDDPDRQDIRP